jgi:regulator of protease activity HflC (stomatin/prohibitin superfamily)
MSMTDLEGVQKKERASLRELLWNGFRNIQFYTYSTVLLLLLTLGFLWPFTFIMVPTGHHGVMYRYFLGGTVTDQIWGEGLHVIPPWDLLTLYENRLIERRIAFSILSEEGLELGVEISVRYRPNKDMLGYLHQDIGPEYYDRLIKPEVEAHVRRTFGNRPAHEIYSSPNDLIQELRGIAVLGRVEDSGSAISTRAYVQIQEIKLINIELPSIVERAIAEKYRQEQLMLEYQYKLRRAEDEAERTRIEAAGIRDYNKIASEISPDLLRWRDLEATLELAKSANTKIIMLGGGGGGVPLLFSLGDAPARSVTDEGEGASAPDSAASSD